MPKRALITGITGQDGSYLAELLLDKGYEVHGMVRRMASEDYRDRIGRIQHLADRLRIHAGAIECQPSVFNVVEAIRPDECYHLAAQSSVSHAAEDEFQTWGVNVSGAHYLLAALKRLAPGCRTFFAASSEIFGAGDGSLLSESSAPAPRSMYGISKLAGLELARHYRSRHGMFVANGILFNHESPRRGFEFVSRKITSTAAAILAGRKQSLELWGTTAARDWGAASDFVEGMWLMLQAEDPTDFVLATGVTRTIEQFARTVFSMVGLDWQRHVELKDRPGDAKADEAILAGDSSKAARLLNWRPRTSFEELARSMLETDLRRVGCDPRRIFARAHA